MSLQTYNLPKIEKWMKGYALKKWESTLDLCVHAHGYDVELIMKTSCKDNCPLVSRGYRAIALPLMNSCWSGASHWLVTLWFWVVVSREHRIPFTSPFLLLGIAVIRFHSLETPRHNLSWSSSAFLPLPCVNWVHGVKYHPCPSMICVIIDNLPWLPANTTWSCISCSAFPWERYTHDTCVSLHFPFPLVCLIFLLI